MRKVCLVAVAALVAGSVFAQLASNEVVSVNVVGYNKVTLLPAGKLVAVGLQFDPFDATLTGVLGSNQLRTSSTKGGVGDQVYVWDTSKSGYNTYRLSTNYWYYEVNSPSLPTNPVLTGGQAFWIKSPAGATTNVSITIMGEVIDAGTQQVGIVSNLQMLAYPFSCDIGVNQTALKANGAATTTTKGGVGDQIYVWDAASQGYAIYRLSTNPAINWYEINSPTVSATATLSLGQGVWYKAKTGGFTWTETNRYLGSLRN